MPEVYFSVKVEGEEVGDLLDRIVVEEADTRAGLATLTATDSFLVLADVLHEGLTVEIDLGWDDAHAVVFRGPVVGVRGAYPAGGRPAVEVQAADGLVRLGLRPRTKAWWNTTVGQVVRDTAVANGLLPGEIAPDPDPVLEEKQPRRQTEETDLAFLFRLARDYDCKLSVDPGGPVDKLNFVATAKLLSADPAEETLAFNVNVEEFAAAADAFAAAARARVVSTDPATGARVEVLKELASAGDATWTPDPDRVAGTGVGADRLASLLAKGAAKRAALTEAWREPGRAVGAAARPAGDSAGAVGDRARRLGQSAHGRARGSVWFRPRRVVQVTGFGGRWSGVWYFARVRHEIDVPRRGYTCSFDCTR
jgi:phage protein D